MAKCDSEFDMDTNTPHQTFVILRANDDPDKQEDADGLNDSRPTGSQGFVKIEQVVNGI